MKKKTFDKIKEGLEDAIAFAKGDTTRCRVVQVRVKKDKEADPENKS